MRVQLETAQSRVGFADSRKKSEKSPDLPMFSGGDSRAWRSFKEQGKRKDHRQQQPHAHHAGLGGLVKSRLGGGAKIPDMKHLGRRVPALVPALIVVLSGCTLRRLFCGDNRSQGLQKPDA